jgi:DNA repair protein RadD
MLRPYQTKLKNDILEQWSHGRRFVCAVLPTGGGKTVIMADIANDERGATAEIAHRQELVFQIAKALATAGVYHRVIGSTKLQRFVAGWQVREFGRSFVHDQAPHAVISVDTILRREEDLKRWLPQVSLWQTDEGHHLQQINKWGRAAALFKNARGVGWTAEPSRGDRKSLHIDHGGCFDSIAIGPDMQWLIDNRFLVPWVIYGPTPSIDVSSVPIGASGEYVQEALRVEAHKSTITGDIVRDYLRLAPGKRGATFVVDLALCADTVKAFQHYGVPAAMISSNTPDDVRVGIMADFRCGLLRQVVNVDILGEGVDVAGIEVVSMGRPTASYQVYKQQGGRCSRIDWDNGKTHGIIIDHVGNVIRHKGPPYRHRTTSLEPLETKRKRGVLGEVNDPTEAGTTCRNPECLRYYERLHPKCPHCGFKPEPGGRDRPEQVDGDLLEYSPELLAALTGEAERITGPAEIAYGSRGAQVGSFINWNARAAAQRELRDSMAFWAGCHPHDSISQVYRRFYLTFNIDAATARTLGAADAAKLQAAIWESINAERQ